MKKFYISLGQNGYSFGQVNGYKVRDLLEDLGVWYDEERNTAELLDAEIYGKDTDSRYGANYYGLRGLFEVGSDDDDDEEEDDDEEDEE